MNKVVQKSAGHPGAKPGLPAHELIYRQLRDLVLFGDLAPGQAVTIKGLTDRLNAGMTPVREAIRRLTAEGALESLGNRRVGVPQLNSEDISELIVARQWLEIYLTRRATGRITDPDLKDMTATDGALDTAIEQGNLRAYLELNYRFHKRIYDAADAPIIAGMATGLWLRFGPSLRVVCGRIGTQNLPDKHKDILTAMRARDVQGAARAICEDVVQGMEQVRRSFEH